MTGGVVLVMEGGFETRSYDRLSSNCTRLCRGITLTPASSAGQALALSHDGRGDKRAFDRLRACPVLETGPNVFFRGCTAVTDTPAWPRARGVTVLRARGFTAEGAESAEGERWIPAYAGMTGGVVLVMKGGFETRPYDRLSSNCTRLWRGITLTPVSSAGQALALSDDGRGDKRAFDRLRPNVYFRGCTAVADTSTWPRARGVTVLRTKRIHRRGRGGGKDGFPRVRE